MIMLDSFRIPNVPKIFNAPFEKNEARARKTLEEIVKAKKTE
jgi:hypothetical protein